MPADLIFLTGGTGHIGFRTLVLRPQSRVPRSSSRPFRVQEGQNPFRTFYQSP